MLKPASTVRTSLSLPALLLSLVLLLVTHVASSAAAQNRKAPKPKVPMSERIDILARTYPDLIYAVNRNTLRTTSNRLVVIDDGSQKTYFEKWSNADLEDQLAQVYPLGKCYRGRRKDFDPGLIWNQAFFQLAYGANEWTVKQGSETVNWFGERLRFSTRHGAADALRRVHADLQQLPAKFRQFLKPVGRTIDWTEDADGNPGIHAFGIAIDLNPDYRDRWRYIGSRARRLNRYRNRIPPEIIEIFERHGFIWAGKWYHFKTNHFEYRPALIAIGRLALKRDCEK